VTPRRRRSEASEERARHRRLRAATPAGRLRTARLICGAFLLFPVVFAAIGVAWVGRPGARGATPVEIALAGLLGALALALLASAGAFRARLARIAISERRAGRAAYASDSALYAAFATASIAGFLTVEMASLLGFVGTVLARSMVPLLAIAVVSYALWAYLWPTARVWRGWAAEAAREGGDG